ncbi:MAG: hypothetical protein C0404_03105 [Verrucomicrobia bacterium]|nr:hypothetical protein [Verrucomicrobiota bacterium]
MGTASHPRPLIERNLPDPFILRAGDGLYLYATGEADDGRFMPIYRSADLVSWEFVAGAVQKGAPGSCNRA